MPLVLVNPLMPVVYKRNYIQRSDAFDIEGQEIGFDCMTELVFAERGDLLAWMTSLGGDEFARDERDSSIEPQPGRMSWMNTQAPAEGQ